MSTTPHFRLAGIPVRVEPVFFVIILILGLNPADIRPVLVATWVGIAFVSILLHEFGHAVAFRIFGIRPSITLYGMGGLTSGSGRLTPVESIIVSLAGPISALVLLGLPAWWLQANGSITSADGQVILGQIIWINIGWSVLNLLPILPLDGGNVMHSVLELITGGKGRRLAEVISIAVAGVVALLALRAGFVFGGVLALMFVGMNVSSLSKVKQDQMADQLAFGHRALIEHKPAEAEQVAHAVLAKRPSGVTLRWASELLGWARLWQGDQPGAQAAVDRYAHAGQPSGSFRAAQALAAGHLTEGVAVMAWAFANEPAGPSQVLGAIAIAGTGQTPVFTGELLALDGDEGVRAAVLFRGLLDYAGYRRESADVAALLDADGRAARLAPG
jgi:Zn-dependent protease